MVEPNYVNYIPRWAQEDGQDSSVLDDTPNIGIEPPYAPRLSTRLVPTHDDSTVSGLTLIDTVLVTQKILTYAAQEAAFGVQFEFADLRSVDSSVEELARMRIEPFEDGSFVVPAVLDERSISVKDRTGTHEVSSRDILKRFVSVLEGADQSPEFAASIGVVSAGRELGKILRRDVTAIEYYPLGFSLTPEPRRRLLVDLPYIERVAENVKRRQDIQSEPEPLEGQLIAVNVPRATLRLRLHDGAEIGGTFERTAAESVIGALNQYVRLHGVVARRNRRVMSIRAVICEPLDND